MQANRKGNEKYSAGSFSSALSFIQLGKKGGCGRGSKVVQSGGVASSPREVEGIW